MNYNKSTYIIIKRSKYLRDEDRGDDNKSLN